MKAKRMSTTEETVTVEEVDGTWKVKPGVKRVSPGDEVIFRAPEYDLLVFITDDLFATRRFRVQSNESESFVVRATERGIYPYFVLVAADEPQLAEGSTAPVFWVD